jgi:hypothetical protein
MGGIPIMRRLFAVLVVFIAFACTSVNVALAADFTICTNDVTAAAAFSTDSLQPLTRRAPLPLGTGHGQARLAPAHCHVASPFSTALPAADFKLAGWLEDHSAVFSASQARLSGFISAPLIGPPRLHL